MNQAFALYPEEQHWWSFCDYAAVLDVTRRLQPKTVLEFGPGSSTLALIEGGAQQIDTCEDAPDWAEVYETRLQDRFPTDAFRATVCVHRYTWADPLTIDGLDGCRWDLALIDGPRGVERRPAAVRYALERCAAVLVPTEDANPSFRGTLRDLADELGWHLAITETGPLQGGFALFTQPDEKPEAEEIGPQPLADVVQPREPFYPFGMPVDDVVGVVTPEPPPLSKRAQKRQRKAGKDRA